MFMEDHAALEDEHQRLQDELFDLQEALAHRETAKSSTSLAQEVRISFLLFAGVTVFGI